MNYRTTHSHVTTGPPPPPDTAMGPRMAVVDDVLGKCWAQLYNGGKSVRLTPIAGDADAVLDWKRENERIADHF